ncbi:hypothetical protein L2E82_29597 [Cichorium intybus]|uniref:Uncharacterized protein n=1 Tax=Cichorium intybus TaxID=13427 RepID=A0ACB9CYD3_CICIN|nr:hypothetical protein L2E82_29597 [Cichorium intybus]
MVMCFSLGVDACLERQILTGDVVKDDSGEDGNFGDIRCQWGVERRWMLTTMRSTGRGDVPAMANGCDQGGGGGVDGDDASRWLCVIDNRL